MPEFNQKVIQLAITIAAFFAAVYTVARTLWVKHEVNVRIQLFIEQVEMFGKKFQTVFA